MKRIVIFIVVLVLGSFPFLNAQITQEQIEEGKNAIEQIGEDVQDLVEDLEREVKVLGEELKQKGKDLWERGKEAFAEMEEEASGWIEENITANIIGSYSDSRMQNNQTYAQYLGRQPWVAYPLCVNASPKIDEECVKFGDTVFFVENLLVSPSLTPLDKVFVDGFSADALQKELDQVLKPKIWEVQCFGTTIRISGDAKMEQLGVGKPKEKQVAVFWSRLAETKYLPTLYQVFDYKQKHHLNDWMYYQLLNELSKVIYPKDKAGQRAVWTAFMLNQTGYDAKLAKVGSGKMQRLVLLFPIYEKVYDLPFVDIDGRTYYVLDELTPQEIQGKLYTYPSFFTGAMRPMSLAKADQDYDFKPIYLKFEGYTYNGRMLEIYKGFPQTQPRIYFQTGMENMVKKSLQYKMLPELEKLPTLTEKIDWIFGQVDQAMANPKKQKRVRGEVVKNSGFYFEEILSRGGGNVYDKAVVKALLVKELLDVPVAVVLYPSSAAVAVADEGQQRGGYFIWKGKTYWMQEGFYPQLTGEILFL